MRGQAGRQADSAGWLHAGQIDIVIAIQSSKFSCVLGNLFENLPTREKMADSHDDKLYKAEYAKSGRASCKKCKENIAKDSLRMAIMVQV